MITRYIFIVTIAFFVQQTFAQTFQFKGRVTDKETYETLAFVNISFDNGRKGVQSNIDGFFIIESKEPIQNLTFSYVGYELTTISIIPSLNTSDLRIAIQRKNIELGEVVVHPRTNPAHRIIERVIDNRDRNNPEKMHSFSYRAYNKMHFTYQEDTMFNRIQAAVYMDSILPDPSNIRMKNKLGKQHLFIIESVSQRLFQYPDKNHEKVISSKVSGFSDPSFTMLATQFQSFSFYNTFVTLLEKNYLNPISSGSTKKYFFLLQDTFLTETLDTLYVISFKPRRGSNFDGLQGVLYINTNGYAIQNVIAGPVHTDNRFAIRVQQRYELIDHSQWFPTQLNTDLLLKKSKIKTRLHKYYLVGIGKSYLSDIKINPDLRDVSFSNIVLDASKDAYKKTDSLWNTYRPLPLTTRDSTTYYLIDSLGRAHDFDQKLNFFDAFVSGNIPWGVFNLDYKRLVGFNDYEGFKLGLGLSTNQKIGSFYSLGGYFSYGFHDKDLKYGSFLQLFPNWQSNTKLTLNYSHDVMETGGIEFFDDYVMNSSEVFRKLYVNRMDYVRKKEFAFSFRALSHLRFNLFLNQEQKTVKDYSFSPNNPDPSAITNNFRFTEAGISLKLGFREKFIQTPNGRLISIGTAFPMIWLNYHQGIKWINGDFEYSKYELKIAKSFLMRVIGKSQIQITAGKAIGNIPLCNLYNSLGTFQQFGIEAENSFATMRINEFFSDEFVSLFLKQNLGSLLFSRPSFRPEISLVMNIGVGRLSNPQYHQIVNFKTLEKGYYESGILVDKLLSMVFLGYGFGVFYRYGPYAYPSPAKNFAYKISLKFML